MLQCFFALCVPSLAWAGAISASLAPDFAQPGETRKFSIAYVAHVPAPKPRTHVLRVWLPVPQSSPAQSISELSFSLPPQIDHEPEHGNAIAYWEFHDPSGPITLTMRFDCVRRELRTDLTELAAAGDGSDPSVTFAIFHRPSRMAVVNDATRTIAMRVAGGSGATLPRARAIYDYVLAHMRYDKSQPGWGTGSTVYACQTGRGNCTDFHSLFDSLCRSAGIAAEFEIGLLLPYDRQAAGPLGGYHCWTYFRVPGRTWVPVDCSEASLEPGLRQYYFGSCTSNRVTLSVGRDLTLTPEQSGPPLNYFVDPYAEADGKPLPATKTWTFTDLE